MDENWCSYTAVVLINTQYFLVSFQAAFNVVCVDWEIDTGGLKES